MHALDNSEPIASLTESFSCFSVQDAYRFNSVRGVKIRRGEMGQATFR